jgi:hypothetical protein
MGIRSGLEVLDLSWLPGQGDCRLNRCQLEPRRDRRVSSIVSQLNPPRLHAVSSATVDVLLLAYNEVDTIEAEVLSWRREVTDQLPGSRVIVAEDGSTDGTTELLQLLQGHGLIVHDHSPSRRGYRGAFLDGLRASTADHVMFADTGAKFDVRDFWALWPYRNDYDLLVGRKVLRTDPLFRKALTWGYNRVLRSYFQTPHVHDADAGFRLMNAPFREWVLGQDFAFKDLLNSEVVIRAARSGWRYGERPMQYHGRDGASKGLPTKQIPKKVWGVLQAFPKVKSETAGNRVGRPAR